MGWILESVAASVGAEEDGIRLLVGLLMAYPVMLAYAWFLRRQSANIQHAYFIASGSVLAYWTIGWECLLHSYCSIVGTYLALKTFGGSIYTASFVAVFQMAYLLIGYLANATEKYVVDWTMPQCVLCLRLIGLAVDCYDGSRPKNQLSKTQLENRLTEVPTLMETCSHVFFWGSYMVGPQHSMVKYKKFIIRNIEDGDMTGSITYGLKRLFLGILYFCIHFIGTYLIPQTYIVSDSFKTAPLWKMYPMVYLWVRSIMSKYVGVWLICEGACVFSGLAYNGRTEDGILWNGATNVVLHKWEYAYSGHRLIESFNINTNAWVMEYIYKRCKFMGNRLISHSLTMLFLAVWHGFHSGYYVAFLQEMFIISFEKDFFSLCLRNSTISNLNESPRMKHVFKLIGMVYCVLLVPHCFVPFALFSSSVYLPVMKAAWIPWIFFPMWQVWKPVATMLLEPKEKGERDQLTSEKKKHE